MSNKIPIKKRTDALNKSNKTGSSDIQDRNAESNHKGDEYKESNHEINKDSSNNSENTTKESNQIETKKTESQNKEKESQNMENKEKEKKRKKRKLERKHKRKNKTKKPEKISKETPFTKLGVSNKLKIPFEQPTNIQKLAIPQILEKKDVIAIARTGSGKTLSFVLPVLSDIMENSSDQSTLKCLIIVPTRELCHQIYNVFNEFKTSEIRIQKIIGGLVEKKEVKNTLKAQILVATPGRLLHYFLEHPTLSAKNLSHLIIDEFDKMIDMGFLPSLLDILEHCKTESTVLLSATYKHETLQQNKLDLNNPKILIDYSTNSIEKFYTITKLKKKIDNLYSLLNDTEKFIVFFSTTKAAKFHFLLFEKIFNCFLLTSDCSQRNRLKSFEDFDRSRSGVLFCTDLASRGLDFKNIDVVVQFDRPEDLQTFIHRIGRIRSPEINEGVDINEGADIQKDSGYIQSNFFGKCYLFLLEGEIIFKEKYLKEHDLKEANSIRRKLNFSKMFIKNNELYEFASKYVKTYEKHLNLSGKEFSSCFSEIKSLKEYLGV